MEVGYSPQDFGGMGWLGVRLPGFSGLDFLRTFGELIHPLNVFILEPEFVVFILEPEFVVFILEPEFVVFIYPCTNTGSVNSFILSK